MTTDPDRPFDPPLDPEPSWRDPRAEAVLRKVALAGGFNRWLDLDLLGAGAGRCEILLRVTDELRQHHGLLHGGLVGTLADTAASWAAASVAGDVVTSSYQLQLLGPARGDRVRAVGAVLKQGRRNVSVEARVFDAGPPGEANAEERLVAVALAQIAVLEGRSAT